MLFQTHAFSLQAVNNNFTAKYNVRLFVLRLDLIHPYMGGNKYFKLKQNLEEAKKQNKNTLLTFGGAFSNHIAAVASAGKEYGFKTIGIIRGEEIKPLNKTLQFASDCGMELHYASREEYRKKNVPQKLLFPNIYLIPEGGSNARGVKGCREIIQFITIDFDYVCCPCGTGATLAGIILSLNNNQAAIGFQVLKGKKYIETEVKKWLDGFERSNQNNWNINENYHFGGYAKKSPELLSFIYHFEKENNIPLEPVYTGKMMFGIYDLIKNHFFEKNKTIVVIHTGGLQGR